MFGIDLYTLSAFVAFMFFMGAWFVIFSNRIVPSLSDQSRWEVGAIYMFGVIVCVIAGAFWPAAIVVFLLWWVGAKLVDRARA